MEKMNEQSRRTDPDTIPPQQFTRVSTDNSDPTQDRSKLSNTMSRSSRISPDSSRPCPTPLSTMETDLSELVDDIPYPLDGMYMYTQKILELENKLDRVQEREDSSNLDDSISQSTNDWKRTQYYSFNLKRAQISKLEQNSNKGIEAFGKKTEAKNGKAFLLPLAKLDEEKRFAPVKIRDRNTEGKLVLPTPETKVGEKKPSYERKEVPEGDVKVQMVKQDQGTKSTNDEVEVEPEVGMNGSPAVEHMDIWEFGDMINDKLEEVAADNPDSTSSDIIEEALGQVIQKDIEGDELCCLDIDDGERRSVTIRWKSNEVCCIGGDALMELLPGPQTRIGGVDCFKLFLDQKLNQIQNGSSNSSTWRSEDGVIDLMNNLIPEAKPARKIQQGAPKKRSHRYPKYRILLKGKRWSESEESGEEEHARRNNPRKRSRIVGQKRQKVHHVISPTSDVNTCPLCAVTDGHQRSDVESLTDCRSDGP